MAGCDERAKSTCTDRSHRSVYDASAAGHNRASPARPGGRSRPRVAPRGLADLSATGTVMPCRFARTHPSGSPVAPGPSSCSSCSCSDPSRRVPPRRTRPRRTPRRSGGPWTRDPSSSPRSHRRRSGGCPDTADSTSTGGRRRARRCSPRATAWSCSPASWPVGGWCRSITATCAPRTNPSDPLSLGAPGSRGDIRSRCSRTDTRRVPRRAACTGAPGGATPTWTRRRSCAVPRSG